jgi:hypothetical protein
MACWGRRSRSDITPDEARSDAKKRSYGDVLSAPPFKTQFVDLIKHFRVDIRAKLVSRACVGSDVYERF